MLGYEERFASDPVFSPIYAYAEREGLPVMFHTGDTATSTGSLAHSHPLTLDPLANGHPGLKIVACHCGNPWIEDTAELIYKHPNVYADISGLVTGAGRYTERYLDSLVRKLDEAIFFAGGADKLLFGTDYPVETYAMALELVRRLEIESADRDKILSKNAERLFSL
jgi:predicted TIM-barrel fold metal-dependent hydrolase